MKQHDPCLTRRAVLGALPLAALTACSGSSRAAGGSPETLKKAEGPTPARTTFTVAPTLSAPPRYKPLAGEVEPRCKEAAVTAVVAALTWSPPQSAANAASRIATGGGGGNIANSLRPFLQDHAASIVRVIYPQYGGVSDNVRSASVMVLAEQTYITASDKTSQRRDLIVDIRLTRSGSTWHATQAIVPMLPPAGPPVSKPTANLLDNHNVVLPGPARADLVGGFIDEGIVQLLLSLGRRWHLNVQVLRSGHPVNVFATNRKSNHTRGRAVDIWAIDGIPVIDQLRCDWAAVMREAADLGATEIGGPALPTGGKPSRPYFTNLVHQDHVHLGFEPMNLSTTRSVR